MSKLMITVLLSSVLIAAALAEVTINGAGATFPYPLYAQWAYQYHQQTGVKLNYQSIGSGGGIQQIKAKTVDFGATDAPLNASELEAAGLLQFPMIVGGVVPIVNLKGIASGKLKLDAATLAKIFLGKITKWNDPAIKSLNPGLTLPNKGIIVAHRADGSGTTWIFTHYLAAVSPEWKAQVGAEKSVKWPVGVGGKGNEGISAYVQRLEGSIGYVEYAYAVQNKLCTVQLKNKAGKFVAPTAASFSAATANADWANASEFYMILIDQPGEASWPITGASFILLRKQQSSASQAQALLKFFDWCFNNGATEAAKLDYVPLPDNVIALVRQFWKQELRCNNQPVYP